VQIETHPSIVVEGCDFMAEPFLRFGHSPLLSGLRQYLDNDGIGSLQKEFRSKYLAWAGERLRSVFRWLGELAVDDRPHLIVFPEFSIPFEHLGIVYDTLWGAREEDISGGTRPTGSLAPQDWIVVAGNHAFDRGHSDYNVCFESEAGRSQSGFPISEVPTDLQNAANSILVTMAAGCKEKKTHPSIHARFKQKLSPFEFQSGHLERQATIPPEIVEGWAKSFKDPFPLEIHPFVCAEALQGFSVKPSARVAVVPAYHDKPDDFDQFLNPITKVRKIGVLASDGRFGGSRVALHPDKRSPSWWRSPPIGGKLPQGDAILVYEVPRDTSVAAGGGSANPFKEDRLVAIASIVSSHSDDEHLLVANEVKHYLAQLEFDNNQRPSRTEQEAFGKALRATLRRYEGSPTQNIKLNYLLRAAELGQLSKSLCRCLAFDCVFGSSQGPDTAGGSSSSQEKQDAFCGSLRMLEIEFASRTYGQLRHLIEAGNLAPDTMSACVSAQRICLEHFHQGKKIGPVPVVQEMLARHKESSQLCAFSNLNRHLGEIVERFSASSGWVFLATGSGDKRFIREIIAHNVHLGAKPLRYRVPEQEEDKCGLTTLCVLRSAPVLSNDVLDGHLSRFYKREVSGTKSEIAVPIFGIDGATVKGVLNLEADEKNAFLPVQLGELQSVAWKLLPDLLIAEHSLRKDSLVNWHPDVSGWGLSSILDDYCNAIATSLSGARTEQSLGCTIWHADWPKAVLYVRAGARFNFEYINRALMPIGVHEEIQPGVPPRSWLAGQRSMTGQSARNKHGTVVKGFVGEMESFYRPEKAKRMGVEYMLSAPIYEPSRIANDGCSSGVLNLYFFRRQHPQYEFSIAGTFPDETVTWLADTAGKILEETKELRRVVAVAKLLARVNQGGLHRVNLPEIFQLTLQECLDVPGVSIFLGKVADDLKDDEVSGLLEVVSTTGIEFRDSVPVDSSESGSFFRSYSAVTRLAKSEIDSVNWTRVKGMTCFLAAVGESALRKIDVADPWETGGWSPCPRDPKWRPESGKLLPELALFDPGNKAKERAEPTDQDHRRFLAVAVDLITPAKTGIVRMVRPPEGRPFVSADAELLLDLARSFRVYLSYLNFCNESGALKARELNAANHDVVRWNRRYVDSLLQHLIVDLTAGIEASIQQGTPVLRGLSPDIAYVRCQTKSPQDLDALRLYAFHSSESSQISRDGASGLIVRKPNSIEWSSLNGSKIFAVYWTDEGEEIQEVSGIRIARVKVTKGARRFMLVVPFSMLGASEGGDATLQIEGEISKTDEAQDGLLQFVKVAIPVVSRVSRLLCCLARDNSGLPERSQWESSRPATLGHAIAQLNDRIRPSFPLRCVVGDVEGKECLFKIQLWYGAFRLPWISVVPLSNQMPLSNINSDTAKQAIISCWRELILCSQYLDEADSLFFVVEPTTSFVPSSGMIECSLQIPMINVTHVQ
tara:strand:+ start:3947 stop:8308 length:4362 start_codon:yes stop_codon:yes gene_type:complete